MSPHSRERRSRATPWSRRVLPALLVVLVLAAAMPVFALHDHALFLPFTTRNPLPAPTQVVTPGVTPDVTPDVTPSVVPDDVPGWLIGDWGYFASASANTGLGLFYTFRADGTFDRTVVVIVNTTYYLTSFVGKYRVSGDNLVFYDRLKGTATAYSWDEIWQLTSSLVEDEPVEDDEVSFGQTEDGKLYTTFVDPDTGDVTTEYSRSDS